MCLREAQSKACEPVARTIPFKSITMQYTHDFWCAYIRTNTPHPHAFCVLPRFCQQLNITVNGYSPLGTPDYATRQLKWKTTVLAHPTIQAYVLHLSPTLSFLVELTAKNNFLQMFFLPPTMPRMRAHMRTQNGTRTTLQHAPNHSHTHSYAPARTHTRTHAAGLPKRTSARRPRLCLHGSGGGGSSRTRAHRTRSTCGRTWATLTSS